MLRKCHFHALIAIAATSFVGFVCAADVTTSKPKDVIQDTENQISQEDITKISEAFGHFIGRNLSSPGIKFDLESIIKGMRDGANGKPAPMSDEDYEAAMVQLQEKAYNVLAQDNLKAANEFLAKNAHVQGVIEIEPGKLQYQILEQGHEPAVTEHGTPLINYVGKFIDGTVFGSSLEVGGPVSLPLDQTIPGFSKGVVGMKEGEKRRLFVHPDFGYGKTGHLPPNTMLIFDIETVKASSPDKELSQADELIHENEDGFEHEDEEGNYEDDNDLLKESQYEDRTR